MGFVADIPAGMLAASRIAVNHEIRVIRNDLDQFIQASRRLIQTAVLSDVRRRCSRWGFGDGAEAPV